MRTVGLLIAIVERPRPYRPCFLSPIGSCTLSPNETPALATPLDFSTSHRRYDKEGNVRTGKVIHAPCGFAAVKAILSLMIGTAIVQCVFTLKWKRFSFTSVQYYVNVPTRTCTRTQWPLPAFQFWHSFWLLSTSLGLHF